MATQHYDIIIVGDAPAARFAGILLARDGRRILHLSGFGWPTYLLWPGSQLLNKLLDKLQARTCLTSPLPIQFHQQNLCCELHGARTWNDEVRRELSDCYQPVLDTLDQLSDWGALTQEALYNLGCSPATNWKHKLAWKLSSAKNGMPGAMKNLSLAQWLDSRKLPARAHKFISGLLCSFALDQATQLNLTEAALIWSQLGNQHMVAPAALKSILTQRLVDAGATTRKAFDLTAIRQGKGRTLTCMLGQESASCDTLIFAGQPGWVIEGLPSEISEAPRPALWRLENFSGKASRLLAPRLLVDSEMGGFQAGVCERDGNADHFVRTGLELSETTELTTEMARLLPFCEFLPILKETATPLRQQRGHCGEQLSFQQDKSILLGAGGLLYPTLGPLAEVITAMNLVAQLKKS